MLLRLALVPGAAIVLAVAGCTSSLTNGTQSNVNGGSVFVVHRRASSGSSRRVSGDNYEHHREPHNRHSRVPDQQLHNRRNR